MLYQNKKQETTEIDFSSRADMQESIAKPGKNVTKQPSLKPSSRIEETLAPEWSPGGGGGQQQLSVVTTVWGVTTSTQSGGGLGAVAPIGGGPLDVPGYQQQGQQGQQQQQPPHSTQTPHHHQQTHHLHQQQTPIKQAHYPSAPYRHNSPG
ncbi:hypothetical protein AAG570_006030 [Ranatra chinensis]|uniref:Uncharacterized protein n=1 Tax=Ranatra chinensis TaxID=642074 RepID=A0ABD0XYM5_9HEMI